MIRAAFIGIDRYHDPLIRDLNGAVRDASALWAVFSDAMEGMEAALLTDEQATLEAVEAVLDATLGVATEDDVVLLSFAGHGTADHRLVLADTRAGDVLGTTLAMAQLATRFRESRARAVVLLLDCCFSGGAPARVLDIGLVPRDIIQPLVEITGQGRVLFAASAVDQAALEDPGTRHGLFTKAILECLLSASEPVSVIGMADRVVQLVRADANRLGYDQTPVVFGHVEGELLLPAGRRGQRYFALFPERGSARTTGAFEDLAAFGLPEEVLGAWQERFPQGLNALQVAAVNEHGVLDHNSLLVVAPTSAGKTFIGEMAAMKAISEGRKAVFLLPYRALVNEKFEDFSAIYGDQLDLRVARCSGDWQDQVGDVLRGKYDLAFFTYEKFLGMAVAAPHMLHQIGLVVVDETQFITEPGRGMVVELLLTHLVSARTRGVSPQLVALSAVIGDVNRFDRWLDCGLLQTVERPVPLTEGVFERSGRWSFVAAEGDVRSEQLLNHAVQQRRVQASSQDLLVPFVRHLVSQGEKIIVFRNARGPSAGCAEYLAQELRLPPAQSVIEALPVGDLSTMSRRLRAALEGGVAFHNSDLNREERVAVERGFRDPAGGIHVLVATSTVAAGVNTPASTVIIVETAFPGARDHQQPYTVAQYKNMAGRAGRLGYESHGKAMLLADNGLERNNLLRQYVQGRPEPVTSSFNSNDPGTWVVRLLAQVRDVPRDAVIDLVANTYGGYLAILQNPHWRESMTQRLALLLDRMTSDGLIEEHEGLLSLTMLGRACGESPLRLESALQAVELLRMLGPQPIALETLLVLVEAIPERDEAYTPQSRQGEAGWQQALNRRYNPEITRLMRYRAPSDRAFYARCKRALVIADWLDGVPTGEIEDRYSANTFSRVGHGDIRGFADGSRFLFDSVLRIAAIVLGRADDPEAVSALLRRLDFGIPVDALPLTLLPVALARGQILALWRAGLCTSKQISGASTARLEGILGTGTRQLITHLVTTSPGPA
ncbi:DEAD/DEAH box helicase [Ancylobacter pratisalsi]|uniref:DEAD/DEAH box helicase n=1 Tax=Ancylobacter pratisalsi TaxID=1745854 RepID=A0A6P1YMR7_9HYPH|nr:DEAD/DEAH box helicase [Ancylobacter pratisalsi]QIB34609.1 DEAD/DEAH box helicase [Ancylobacter pratisalsi]